MTSIRWEAGLNKYLCILMLLSSAITHSNELVLPEPTEENSGFISSKDFSIALGLGIPYGVLGPTVNYRAIDEVEVFVGKGTWGTSWGARVYPISQLPRARLSAFYGVNTIVGSCSNDSCDIMEDGYSGWNLGAGIGPEVGISGWEFDLIYILDQGGYEDDLDEAREAGYELKEEKATFQVAFGYRWNF